MFTHPVPARMTRTPVGRRSALGLAASAAVLSQISTAGRASAATSKTNRTTVIAHRGSSGIAPENTIAAIELAREQRSDVVENDIQRTSDGHLVIVHDTTLTRTTDVEEVFPSRAPWNVRDFTLAEIKRLDAGSWFAPEFAGLRIPTLSEWLRAVGRTTGMLLEPKAPELYPGIEHDLKKVLDASPEWAAALRRGDGVVQSFNHDWLRTYARLAPEVPVGLLFAGGPPSEAQLADAATWAAQANPALGDLSAETVEQIHAHGLVTNCWTVNDGQGMRRAINWGVDGVITNYPQVLREIVEKR